MSESPKLVRKLDTRSDDFAAQLDELRDWNDAVPEAVETAVRDILRQVRSRGDEALLEFTQKFDRHPATSMDELVIDRARLQQARDNCDPNLVNALEEAAERIREYAVHQKMNSWSYTDEDGNMLGQQVTPLDRVGIYVPGGKAAYPSSVLMNAIPARVAGVEEIIMVSPSPDGVLNDVVLTAALIAGVDKVVMVGGAQAVAALAYGTDSVPPVDKIVGPGNIYVAVAKRQVFGVVGIDMIAGPSEILVICDGKTDVEWIVNDLFSQAEHDEDAQALLLCPDQDFINAVEKQIEMQLPTMQRAEIIKQSMGNRSALIKVKDIDEACELSNMLAPEHLELSVAEPDKLLNKLRHAGAIFMGRYTAEVLGDYCAGPNHVLPTARTARFSSPLGVYDFQKRSSIIHCSPEGSVKLGATAQVLAHGEGLEAHAMAAACREDNS